MRIAAIESPGATTIIIHHYISLVSNQQKPKKPQGGRSIQSQPYTIERYILTAKGPVTTQNTLRSNFTKLRHITKEEFVAAAKQLQAANLGSLVSVPSTKGSRPSTLFLKKPPEEVQNILSMTPNLCSPEEYSDRFHMRIPALISFKMRAQLLTLGLLSEKQLK